MKRIVQIAIILIVAVNMTGCINYERLESVQKVKKLEEIKKYVWRDNWVAEQQTDIITHNDGSWELVEKEISYDTGETGSSETDEMIITDNKEKNEVSETKIDEAIAIVQSFLDAIQEQDEVQLLESITSQYVDRVLRDYKTNYISKLDVEITEEELNDNIMKWYIEELKQDYFLKPLEITKEKAVIEQQGNSIVITYTRPFTDNYDEHYNFYLIKERDSWKVSQYDYKLEKNSKI